MLTESLLIAGAFTLGFLAASILAALAFGVLTDIHREEQKAAHRNASSGAANGAAAQPRPASSRHADRHRPRRAAAADRRRDRPPARLGSGRAHRPGRGPDAEDPDLP
jgi:hypothetical protein